MIFDNRSVGYQPVTLYPHNVSLIIIDLMGNNTSCHAERSEASVSNKNLSFPT
ncbi:MAG: hypothetical protein JW969_19940 [Spirochaetales bacterium]|nr:hypothetical protein [Spirochaetales bacterium]